MARRRRRSDSGRQSEVSFTTSNLWLPRPIAFSEPSPLSSIEDRRQYHPDRQFQPARMWSGRPASVRVTSKRPNRFRIPVQLGFVDPGRVVMCAKRKIRKEVLFAKRLTRKGSYGRKRRNWFSKIGC